MSRSSLQDVNVNEWKIEVVADNITVEYVFPDRVIRAGATLRCWKHSAEDVVEDEENVLMNVDLPLADTMGGKITNDMAGVEASFELRKCHGKRKILKAKSRQAEKEGCSIM